MRSNIVVIGATVAKNAADKEQDTTAKIRAAMKEMSHFWLTTDEDERLRAALAGAISSIGIDTPDGLRLQDEVRFWTAISKGTLEGLPTPGEFEPFGIMAMWQEATKDDQKAVA